jgi:signal transduction histidine kinase
MGKARQDRMTATVHADSARLAWVLLGIMALVVLSFVSVFFLAVSRGRLTGRDIDGIVNNALPSVEELTAARGDLRRLDAFSRDSADSVTAGEPRPPAEAVAGLRRDLDESLAAYFELPMFPGERELSSGVAGQLADLDRAIAALQAAVGAADVELTRGAKREEIHRAERLDDTLERLVDLNATNGQELGLAIEVNRAETRRMAMHLDALAGGLALLAMGVAVVAMRRTFHTLEIDRATATQRASALGQRSAELEQFAGRMAHDVLSPLNSVSLALEFLRRRIITEDARMDSTVGRALSSLQRVRRIVDGLLEFARAGASPEPGATADLRSILDDVIEGAQPEAVEQRIHLVAEPFATCSMACSPGVLTSLCANLVHNAIRHMSDACERTVTVRVKEHGGQRRVEIEDTGPGVPPEIEETLFNPFVRAHGNDPGVGLGLATVRRLAQGHGGEAGFRPKPEGGSVFWFELSVVSEAGAPHP